MPNDTKYTLDQILQQSSTPSISINKTNHSNNSYFKENNLFISPISSPSQSPAGIISKKRRTISISSDDDDDVVELVPENDCRSQSKRRSIKQPNLSLHKRDDLMDQI
jgi:hypothetical protein